MKKAKGIERLLRVVSRLRGKKGCPWDRKQTLDTLKQYLVEESYEVLDAIDSRDPARHLEELGDLLLQVVLQSQIRREQGAFTFRDVAERLADKLIRRHPHVFGSAKAGDVDTVLKNWEEIKIQERKSRNAAVLSGIPRHLPELQKAQRIQSKAAKVGFDWNRKGEVLDKIDEELRELKTSLKQGDAKAINEEIGDLLFTIVNLCRFVDVRAEESLGSANRKFMRRFGRLEKRVLMSGRKLSCCALAELESHWNAIKKTEKRKRKKKRGAA